MRTRYHPASWITVPNKSGIIPNIFNVTVALCEKEHRLIASPRFIQQITQLLGGPVPDSSSAEHLLSKCRVAGLIPHWFLNA